MSEIEPGPASPFRWLSPGEVRQESAAPTPTVEAAAFFAPRGWDRLRFMLT